MITFELQRLNYLSIRGLERIGLEVPTQAQIDCLEGGLNETLELMSVAILLLDRAGIKSPKNSQIRHFEHKLFELVEQYKTFSNERGHL